MTYRGKWNKNKDILCSKEKEKILMQNGLNWSGGIMEQRVLFKSKINTLMEKKKLQLILKWENGQKKTSQNIRDSVGRQIRICQKKKISAVELVIWSLPIFSPYILI